MASLPLAAAYCRRLGIVELVNTLVPSKMDVSPGHVVQAMVLDTLSGRSPLYRVEEFLNEQDTELLLGTSIEAHKFNDTNIGRSLDAIFNARPSRILTEIGINATKIFNLNPAVVSYDTTSTKAGIGASSAGIGASSRKYLKQKRYRINHNRHWCQFA